MSSNPEVSRQTMSNGTTVIVYQNGVRCVKNGNVFSWYYPNQNQWHYREVLNPVTGRFTSYTQEVDTNAVDEETVQG